MRCGRQGEPALPRYSQPHWAGLSGFAGTCSSGTRLFVLPGRGLPHVIPGVIVAPLPAAHGLLNMDWKRFSAVAIGYSLLRPSLHRVTTDRFQAMRLAIYRLQRLRYSRIGLAMHSNQDARVNHQWGAAFLWEQQQIPSSERIPPLLVEERDWHEHEFAKWFEVNRPDVILGYDPSIIAWLKKLGRRVPEDVGFAHLWTPDCSGQFAGLYHNPPAIGSARDSRSR